MNLNIKTVINEVILEFKEDLKKQCILLMGLPASGKSTFIKNDIKKYIPNAKSFKISNSDNQVMASQYKLAIKHYNWLLSNVKDESDINSFIKDSAYINNDGKNVKIPLTYEWWILNKDIGIKNYYITFYKSYYSTFFDFRDYAKQISYDLFSEKIIHAGNIIIIDSTGANYNHIFDFFQKSRNNEYTNTIIYLDIDIDLAIERDKWRRETQGRGIGEIAVRSYIKKIEKAFNVYMDNGNNKNGLVDRLIHFHWKRKSMSPTDGEWKLISDDKFFIKRKMEKYK